MGSLFFFSQCWICHFLWGRCFGLEAATAPALQLSPAGDMSLDLTPALVAASYGQTKAVGSNKPSHFQSMFVPSCLHVSIWLCCYLQVLEFLKAAGADLTLARQDGATALDLAIDQEHTETVLGSKFSVQASNISNSNTYYT